MVSRATLAVVLAALAAGCAAAAGLGHAPAPAVSRGMWVWSSAALLDHVSRQEALFQFSRDHGLRVLWLQITTRRVGGGAPIRLEVSRAQAWRSLIAAAHARGFTVEALDGDPTDADRAFHEVPLAITDAVLTFNRDSPVEARFDGLHLNNEPYLLPGWHDRATRERLLEDYLALNDEIQRRVRTQPPMTFGVDVPFWWSATDPQTGEAIAAVSHGGTRQSASLHCLERLDWLTVMDYRNHAEGPNGLVALAIPLLADAARIGHARVRVGVETTRLATAPVWFAIGPRTSTIGATLGQSWRRAFPGEPFRLRGFDDGMRVHLGVDLTGERDDGAPSALVDIARKYGLPLRDGESGDVAGAVRGLGRDAEWRDPRPAAIRDPMSGIEYAGVIATYVPLQTITFATRPAALRRELATAERIFRQFWPFGGLAIHHYDAYRELAASTDR